MSVARTTRVRAAVSSMRARATHHRSRTRATALGSPSGEKYQFNKDNEMNEKSIKRKRGGIDEIDVIDEIEVIEE